MKLSAGDSKSFKQVLKRGETAFKHLHTKGTYHPKDLFKETPYVDFINETFSVFDSAISQDIPDELSEYLRQDVFVFSALKTHTQLTEARSYLQGDDGGIVPYYKFEKQVLKLNKTYNTNYLEAEYLFAQQSSQSAANWQNLQSNTDRYHLQYRTAGDDRVRISHQVLNQITLPKNDPFWAKYYPPNGWRCRCLAVEVLASDYTPSNSAEAIEAGKKATTHIGKSGKNKLEMFRFNPGQDKKVFPTNNTYTKVVGSNTVKKQAKKQAKKSIKSPVKQIKTLSDLNTHFEGYAAKNTHLFARGFKSLKTTRKRSINGETDLNGNIWLKSPIMNEVKGAINNIKNGVKTTRLQEQSLSTLHHEIIHNANVKGNMRLTRIQTRYMELANEFVSRNRLPEFMKSLGGKLENKDFITNRDNTGYNTMVRNYDTLIDFVNVDKIKVLERVEKHLINESYTVQKTGLINAITDVKKMNKTNVSNALSKALNLSENGFKIYLEEHADLFKTNKR